jgi:hypothetical protein
MRILTTAVAHPEFILKVTLGQPELAQIECNGAVFFKMTL